ncbi:hypothetical protein pdam_00012944 [Pocillopora damicornis]|uniref:Uncharacterized protein n=1 Tax=Pocillopora damicornis TaxID=46731 RepID=A0A3M6TVX7_POCDA|nr:hypothetical protein pdam_00012944 [Pocillopora damicornis]
MCDNDDTPRKINTPNRTAIGIRRITGERRTVNPIRRIIPVNSISMKIKILTRTAGMKAPKMAPALICCCSPMGLISQLFLFGEGTEKPSGTDSFCVYTPFVNQPTVTMETIAMKTPKSLTMRRALGPKK